jgi:beta-lactamase class A
MAVISRIILSSLVRFVKALEMIAAVRVICFTMPFWGLSFCARVLKALSEKVRPNSFVTPFVGLVVVFFYYDGFCATNAVADLQKQFAAIARDANGKVGVAVELLEAKESVMLNGQEKFPMQSVYKLPIAMAALHGVDEGTLKLEQLIQVTTNDFVTKMQNSPIRDAHPLGAELSVSNLLRQMISESDGTACDVLLRVLGGPASVDHYLLKLGVTNIVVATTEKAMGQDELVQYRNWATPEGMTELLGMLHEGRGLSGPSRRMLLQFMTESFTGPYRIRGLLPAGTRVAHKTGSSRTVGGLARATNEAGIVTLPDGRHLAITVFVSDSVADNMAREAVIAKISRAAWDYWRFAPRPPGE